ncbi:FAD-dependent oxidoreductase, partial [Arenicella sp.]|nr:FAD-dependent oxidoreductase [Arenicella sp.]
PFGDKGAEWAWQEGGKVKLQRGPTSIAIRDLTGFNGRVDALVLTNDPAFVPDNSSDVLPAWRRTLMGIPEEPIDESGYDLVIVGGGYAGSCAAISAARMGIKVALIQNRGVLGGNGSSEVRVWAKGNTPPGLYPLGDIVNAFSDSAKKSPGTYEEFEDEKKEKMVRAEKNISLFLNHHAYKVDVAQGSPNRVAAVYALDTRTNEVRRFAGKFFSDCTGHGTIGMMAGAEIQSIPKGRMGMSNMWAWENTDGEQKFPETPWALDLEEEDFPYPKDFHAQWFWESGFDKDPLKDLELIRDWNLRASFGAWNAIKNKGAFAEFDPDEVSHRNARLTWLAYVGGTRETQQLIGDVVLTKEDVQSKRSFPDGCVLSTWSIDLHYPKEQYAKNFMDNPFISVAVHGKGVDRAVGYPVPYRCFYSKNIDNLFMAGRNISVTHEALGTTRVMRTCGMMGVVVGKAASICIKEGTNPRGVYEKHLEQLIDLMRLPGVAHRSTVKDEMIIPDVPLDVSYGAGIISNRLPGIVVDDRKAKMKGNWSGGTGLTGYVDFNYLYAGGGENDATIAFETVIPQTGKYEVRVAYRAHENRASNVSVTIIDSKGTHSATIDQKKEPAHDHGFHSVGEFEFEAGKPATVILSTKGADGNVCADAVQWLKK